MKDEMRTEFLMKILRKVNSLGLINFFIDDSASTNGGIPKMHFSPQDSGLFLPVFHRRLNLQNSHLKEEKFSGYQST